MPYQKVSELPASVKDNLPSHAQEIYKEAYNSAWEQYKDPAERRGDASREKRPPIGSRGRPSSRTMKRTAKGIGREDPD